MTYISVHMCMRHEFNLCLGKQGSQLLLGWADRTVYIRTPKASVRLQVAKKAILQSECNSIQATVTLLNRTLESTPEKIR